MNIYIYIWINKQTYIQWNHPCLFSATCEHVKATWNHKERATPVASDSEVSHGWSTSISNIPSENCVIKGLFDTSLLSFVVYFWPVTTCIYRFEQPSPVKQIWKQQLLQHAICPNNQPFSTRCWFWGFNLAQIALPSSSPKNVLPTSCELLWLVIWGIPKIGKQCQNPQKAVSRLNSEAKQTTILLKPNGSPNWKNNTQLPMNTIMPHVELSQVAAGGWTVCWGMPQSKPCTKTGKKYSTFDKQNMQQKNMFVP